jgi:integrase
VVVPREITATKRVRKYFKTQEEAQAYCDQLCPASYPKLDPHPLANNGERLDSCAQQWLGRFRQSRMMFFQCRQVMKSLSAHIGYRPIGEVGVSELDAWLRSLESQYAYETRKNYWRRTRQFFTYCHNFGFIAKNPFVILKQPKRREKAKRHILTPQQMKDCLKSAQGDRALTAYLCLGGFAGIRTSEILRMDWNDLFWTEGEIRIRHAKEINNSDSKDVWIDQDEEISGDRLVTMEGAFRRHLEPLALKGEAIERAAQRHRDGGRGSRKIIPGGQRALYVLRARLRELLGVQEWPDNCLRHSYRSYHAAAFRDLERTRLEMGHSDPNTTRYKYGAARLKSVAEEWWSL